MPQTYPEETAQKSLASYYEQSLNSMSVNKIRSMSKENRIFKVEGGQQKNR